MNRRHTVVGLSADCRPTSLGPLRSRPFHGSDRRTPRRERSRSSSHTRPRRRGALRSGFFVQILAAARHARSFGSFPGSLTRLKSSRLSRIAAAAGHPTTPFQRGMHRPHPASSLEKRGRHMGQLAGRSPYLQSMHIAVAADRIGEIVPALITAATTNSLSGVAGGDAYGMTAFTHAAGTGEFAEGRTQLEFDDNLLLPLLYGERDQHLQSHRTAARRFGCHARQPLGNLRPGICHRGRPSRACSAIRSSETRTGGRPVGGRRRPFVWPKRKLATKASISGGKTPLSEPASGASHRALRAKQRTSRLSATMSWFSGWGQPAPASNYIAVAAAVDLLMTGRVERITYRARRWRPAKGWGFLPGDLRDKVDPYLAADLRRTQRHAAR